MKLIIKIALGWMSPASADRVDQVAVAFLDFAVQHRNKSELGALATTRASKHGSTVTDEQPSDQSDTRAGAPPSY